MVDDHGKSAADRIAAAPRAWALETAGGEILVTEIFDDKDSAEMSAELYGPEIVARVLRIALVPLTEKEAQQ